MGQTNTTTTISTRKVKQIIGSKYNEKEQELNLRTSVDSGDYKNEWRSVLEFQNWTSLRTLNLSNEVVTQLHATLEILVPDSWALCHGPISKY